MELRWNLSELYSDTSKLQQDINKLKELSNKIIATKGKLTTKQGLLDFYNIAQIFSWTQEKIVTYLFLRKSLNGADVFALEKLEELENFLQQHSLNITFVLQEMKTIPNKTLLEWSKLPEFKDFDQDLKDIIKIKKHTLPESQEKLMIGASYTANHRELMDCLDNVEIKYGKTKDEQGKTVNITNQNAHVLSSSNIKEVRKATINKIYKAYKSLNQTIATNFISHLKYSSFVAKAYKYKNTLDMCLKTEDLPNNLPQIVVKNVNDNLGLLHKYYAWRKQFMKLDKFESCDIFCNIFDNNAVNQKYTLPQAISIIKKALKPLGTEYTNMLDTAVKNNWIDSVYLPAKETGAYCLCLYGMHPHILLTYDDTQNSVTTLAHEFGHAMNAYYSNKTQPYSKCENEIFLAEIASTVNEVLLADYFISTAKNTKEKILHITNFLSTFISTVFTQTEYTEFELYVHNCIDQNEPLNYKKLNDFYLSLQKKYCGKDVNVLKLSQYHWSRIPHFYRDFYVFKYVTGFISACAIVNKLKQDKNYKNTYIQFLSAGSSEYPCDILKNAQVDILDANTYKQAFELFKSYIDILKNTKE